MASIAGGVIETKHSGSLLSTMTFNTMALAEAAPAGQIREQMH